MVSFISSVLNDLQEQKINFEKIQFILPSKRAGVFLKNQLANLIEQPIFSPEIKSIEEFVEELSELTLLPNVDLLFQLYSSYKKLTNPTDLESFETFSKWSQILLQDFNEIDRFLLNQQDIFDYLNAINDINHWSLEKNQTELIKKYLKFWNRLNHYYTDFTENLLRNKNGYQGLIYREAFENLEVYIANKSHKLHVFVGFNALNKSESLIIQGLLENEIAQVYWDIDETFINDPIHDAGLFIRNHKSQWNYFKNHSFKWINNHYKQEKNIEIVGIPKLVGQAKYIGELLRKIKIKDKDLKNIAVVLGEEALLIPVLNSLPASIKQLNVTMGLDLKHIPLATMFNNLFQLHKSNAESFYFKDVIRILTHPSISDLFKTSTHNTVNTILSYIQTNNLVYITSKKLKEITEENHDLIGLLFNNWENEPSIALNNCSLLIFKIKNRLDQDKSHNQLELEYLYRFNTLFNQLKTLNENYSYLNTIEALLLVYKELLSSESLDFKGEPLEGLQIMGMLESRVLDFETVIISSVNEGILPSGKSNNSFIPFDIKIEKGLPTFKEKDAVYTYHFYHLLQRAKNIYIIYNTENDALNGGEKSRFITQLKVENIHNIRHKIASPKITSTTKNLEEIIKTDQVINRLNELCIEGFSPSSLCNYVRNPLDFYYEKILNIKEFEDVEENIAANTMGSVIHNTLDNFYRPYEGKLLNIEYLSSLKKLIQPTVEKHFKNLYKEGDFTKGKNLIIFNIAQHYIDSFIKSEIESLKSGNEIKIIAVEAKVTTQITVKGLNSPVRLKGTVDRIDEFNGVTRIIDYKSGKVEQGHVEIVDWADITTDYKKYSKSFQILCYAYMLHKENHIQLPVEAGIISFKNLKKGFLKFGTKPSPRARNKNQIISGETLTNFENELAKLITEICDPEINFKEKEI